MREALKRAFTKNSELKTKLNELRAQDEPDTTAVETASKEYADSEVELRAAIAADDDADVTPTDPESPEDRERREIRAKVTLAEYVKAGVDGKAHSGAAAEYSAAMECPGLIPWDLIEPEPAAPQREARAVTAAPTTTGVNLDTVQPDVFLAPAAEALRVDMPTVPAGTAAYPVMSTSLTAAARDKGKAAPVTAGAITVTTVAFKRVTGQFQIAIEDMQKLGGLESVLRANLGGVMGDAIDVFVVNGVTAVNNVVGAVPGFFSAVAPLVTPASAEGTTTTFPLYVGKMASALDGKFARNPGDVSLVTGPEVQAHMLATYADSTGRSAYSEIRDVFRGVTATDRIAVASGVQAGIAVRHSVPGRVAVSPRWTGFEIRDPYTDAGKGIVTVTMAAMIATPKVLRSGVYKGLSFKTTA